MGTGFESLPETNQHPVDAFFDRMGLPEGFGQNVITYHGREILARDYFDQPDVNPLAKMAHAKLSNMDPEDPNFPAYRDAFLSGAAPYLGIN